MTDLRSQIFYAGCLDSDPYFCLKQCDRVIVSELNERGVGIRELQKELPEGKLFRKLNRKALYPALVAKVTRNQRSAISGQPGLCQQPATSNQQPPILHIGSQCYANLIPIAQRLASSAQPLVSITVHDVAEFDYSEGYARAQLKRWRKRIDCVKSADVVFAVSDFTRQEIVQKAGVLEEKIIVNHNGVDPIFQPLEKTETEARYPDIAKLKEDHFLILVTSADLYRKNLPTLLKAIAVLRERGVPATIIKTGDSLITHHASRITQLGLTDSIHDLGYVSQEALAALYNLCDVLAFPSLYEGFGMPVVEAQRCGLPCVISNAASLPEIAGDGALYHDPRDVEGLSDQLQRIFEDENLRTDLREKGFHNAQRFSWEKHVETLMKGFQRVLGS